MTTEKTFNRYNDIENVIHQNYLNKLMINGYNEREYVITEKIHGSNLGFAIDLNNGSTYYMSRNNIVDENFMGGSTGRVFAKINPNINNILNNLSPILEFESKNNNISQYKYLIIYGELFGGVYEHSEVEKDPQGVRIQKGINYCPFNDWLAFDAVLLKERDTEELEEYCSKIKEYEKELETCEDEARIKILKNNINMFNKMFTTLEAIYLSFNDFLRILENSNIRTVPILKYTSSLREALDFGNEFESEVYKLYNLPRIENNYAEGVVIKPLVTEYMDNHRVIIKNKNSKFEEVSNPTKNKSKKIDDIENNNYDKITNKLIENIIRYVNENRLNSTLSKIPRPIDSKNFGMVNKEMSIDVINDMEKDFEEDFKYLKTIDEYKIFTKTVSKRVSNYLKTKIYDIFE